MTLKQIKLIEGIKKELAHNTNKDLKDIGIEAGYSIKARNIYRSDTKKHILEELSKLGYSKEDLQKRFEIGSELSLKKSDLTNYLRSCENLTRMEGLYLDKSETKLNISEEKKADILRLSERLQIKSEN